MPKVNYKTPKQALAEQERILEERKESIGELAEIGFGELLCDPQFQIRDGLHKQMVERYTNVLKSRKAMPPIKVGQIEGRYYLIDGWHRVAAHKAVGNTKTLAHIFQCGILEALWLAAEANLEHGLPLKNKDYRKAFNAYIRARRHIKDGFNGIERCKSYREIGKDLAVVHTTIRNWMLADHPEIAARMSGDENFVGNGCPREGHNDKVLKEVEANINRLHCNLLSVSDPYVRGEIIVSAEDMVAEMRRSGNFEIPESPAGFEF